MAWSALALGAEFSVSEIVTAAKMNLKLADNLRYLKGLDGPIALSDALGLTVNTNAAGGTTVTQSNAGASAFASMYMVNDGGSIGGLIRNSQANTTYGGANALNLLTFGAHPLALGTNNAVRMLLDANGNVGIGTLAPQAKLHVVGAGGGGFAVYTFSVGAATITILPAASVTTGFVVTFVTRPSTGTPNSGTATVATAGGATGLYSDGGTNALNLTYAADGSVTLARTAGTRTYTGSLTLVYF